MLNPNLAAECKEKIVECTAMLTTYHYQGHALFNLADLHGAKKAFNVAIEVSDSLLATCDVAARHHVQLDDIDPASLAIVIDITKQFREQCVAYVYTISKLLESGSFPKPEGSVN